MWRPGKEGGLPAGLTDAPRGFFRHRFGFKLEANRASRPVGFGPSFVGFLFAKLVIVKGLNKRNRQLSFRGQGFIAGFGFGDGL